jgi:NADH dehydrogenase FAD-containing subunit
VCELALTLADKFRRRMARGDVNIAVVFPHTLEKAFAGSSLFRDIEKEFERKGIEVAFDFAISKVDAGKITSATGSSLPYDLLTLIPPFTTQFGLQDLGPVADLSGFLEVDEFLQVGGANGIYAAGDVVSLPGPRFGYMAIRQGKVAASNILADLRGDTNRTEYAHRIAWLLKEKYTGPTYFHYGVWDETLADFDDDALLGIAREMRGKYGSLRLDPETLNAAA